MMFICSYLLPLIHTAYFVDLGCIATGMCSRHRLQQLLLL